MLKKNSIAIVMGTKSLLARTRPCLTPCLAACGQYKATLANAAVRGLSGQAQRQPMAPALSAFGDAGCEPLHARAASQDSTRSAMKVFFKERPWELSLATLSVHHLALMTYAAVRKQGYKLCKSEHSTEDMSLATMEHIVRQTHDPPVIRARNAYLAVDMLERAISRKNDRNDRGSLLLTARPARPKRVLVRSLQRALLMPQVNPSSRYRCSRST